MSIRLIATVVIAALLTTGTVATIPKNAEYGTPTEATTTTPVTVETLTAEEAAEIALTHANLTQDVVKNLRTKLDKDERTPEWEVEFEAGGWEYDYNIHAQSGAILDFEREKEPEKPVQTEPAKPAEPVVEEKTRVTAEQAVEIALTHAGLTRQQIRDLDWEWEKTRKGSFWEVEFEADGWEYDYNIHAQSGAILDFEREKEPEKPVQTEPAKPAEPVVEEKTRVTAEQAVEIALTHAGLTRQQIRDLDWEWEKTRKGSFWEVEFEADGWEYEYKIDDQTGEILFSEKERDDET